MVGPSKGKKGTRQLSGSVAPSPTASGSAKKQSRKRGRNTTAGKKSQSAASGPNAAAINAAVGVANRAPAEPQLAASWAAPKKALPTPVPGSTSAATTVAKQTMVTNQSTSVDGETNEGTTTFFAVPTGGDGAIVATGPAAAHSSSTEFALPVYLTAHQKRCRRHRRGLCPDIHIAARLHQEFRHLMTAKLHDQPKEHLHERFHRYAFSGKKHKRMKLSLVTPDQTYMQIQPQLIPQVSGNGNSYWNKTGSMVESKCTAGTEYTPRVDSRTQYFAEDGILMNPATWASVGVSNMPAHIDPLCPIISMTPGTTSKWGILPSGDLTGATVAGRCYMLDPSDPLYGSAGQGGYVALVMIPDGGGPGSGYSQKWVVPATYTNSAAQLVKIGDSTMMALSYTITAGFNVGVNSVIGAWTGGFAQPDAVTYDLPDGATLDDINAKSIVSVCDLNLEYVGDHFHDYGTMAAGVLPQSFTQEHNLAELTYDQVATMAQRRDIPYREGVNVRLPPWGLDYSTFKNTDTWIGEPDYDQIPLAVVAVANAAQPCTVGTTQHVQGIPADVDSQLLTTCRRGGDPDDIVVLDNLASRVSLCYTQAELPKANSILETCVDALGAIFPRVGSAAKAGIALAEMAKNLWSGMSRG